MTALPPSPLPVADYEVQHPWLELVIRPWTVVVMMGCLALAGAELLKLFYPATLVGYFVITAMLGALLGYSVHRLGMETVPSASERRSMQLLVLAAVFFVLKTLSFLVEAFVAMKTGLGSGSFISFLSAPWPFFVAWGAELQRVVASHLALWAAEPHEFFDVTTLASSAFFLISWSVAIATAKDFARVGEPTADREEHPPLRTLTQRFLAGGVLLLIFAGLARTDLWYSLVVARPPVSVLIVNVLLYTILGFLTVAHTQLLARLRRWQNERAHIADDLAQRWLRYGLLFMLGAAALAAVLPTGFTAPLLEWGRWALWGVLWVGTLLVYLLTLFLWPLAWLISWLFGTAPPATPNFEAQPPPTLADAPANVITVAPQFLVLRTLVVLALLLGGLAFLFRRYWQEHPAVQARWNQWRYAGAVGYWFRRVLMALRRLKRRARVWFHEGLRKQPSMLEALAPLRRATGEGRIETPRARILAAYLDTLEVTAAAGAPRRPNQTPDEYQDVLAARFSTVKSEMGGLTVGFDEARYSRHLLTAEDAERAWLHARAIAQALESEAEPPDAAHS